MGGRGGFVFLPDGGIVGGDDGGVASCVGGDGVVGLAVLWWFPAHGSEEERGGDEGDEGGEIGRQVEGGSAADGDSSAGLGIFGRGEMLVLVIPRGGEKSKVGEEGGGGNGGQREEFFKYDWGCLWMWLFLEL